MSTDRRVTVHLPTATAGQLEQIASREARTLAEELRWLALKRVQRMGGSKAAKGRNDDEVRVTVRMPRELADQLKAAAEQQDRTVGAEVRRIIRKALAPLTHVASAADFGAPESEREIERERDPLTDQ